MNESKQPMESRGHEFCVKGRRSMTLSGVKEIISFDEQTVHLSTVNGELTVDGDGLRVKVLDVERGCVSLEGRIDGVNYVAEQTSERRGFWSRLVKQ